MEIKVREMLKSEYKLLETFLYEAIFVPAGVEKPPKSIVKIPELQEYIRDFGESAHDIALVAELNGRIVGAVWIRIMNDYGHIDDNTPSLAMSVLGDYRGVGIGSSLLNALFVEMKEKKYSRVSLSVQKENRAFNLYKRMGFETVRESPEEYIMIKTFV